MLSSYWLANEERITFIWNQIEWALYNFELDSYLIKGDIIQNVINNNDVEAAQSLIKEYGLICPNNQNIDKTLL